MFLLEEQVKKARMAFAQLHLECQLCPFLVREALLTFRHMLMLSCLDFCNKLYIGLNLQTIHKHQQSQKAVECIVRTVLRFTLLCDLH